MNTIICRFTISSFLMLIISSSTIYAAEADMLINNLIKKYTKMPAEKVSSLETIVDITEQFKNLSRDIQKRYRKDIDRLLLQVLTTSMTDKSKNNWAKLDRIRDLASMDATVDFSEFFSRMLLQEAQKLYSTDPRISEREFLDLGVLGAIGRNANASDDFLSTVMKTILDMPIKGAKGPKPPSKGIPKPTTFGTERLRNLKSLGKNEQASAKFLTELAEAIINLKDLAPAEVPMALKEYLLVNRNLPLPVRERINKLVK